MLFITFSRLSDFGMARGIGRGGAEGAAAPHTKKEEKRERGEEERKKEEKRGIKKLRKLNHTLQEHVVIGLWQPQTSDRNGVSISRLASAPPFAKSCLRPCKMWYRLMRDSIFLWQLCVHLLKHWT